MDNIPKDTKKVYYSWKEFELDRSKMTSLIKGEEFKTGRRFSRIYGIPRGGLVLGVCLSHDLGIEFMESRPLAFDHEIIIVDEIADSGKTLKKFSDMGYFIATLHWYRHGCLRPNIWMKEKQEGTFIVYPWEKQERGKP